jgi:predicted SnoaL-like aldol condensation-catalyzing enzyme
VSVVAEGDLVVVSVVRELDDPRKPGTKYTTTWFDMWRILDGKADEHWDYGTIAPSAAGTPAAPGGLKAN